MKYLLLLLMPSLLLAGNSPSKRNKVRRLSKEIIISSIAKVVISTNFPYSPDRQYSTCCICGKVPVILCEVHQDPIIYCGEHIKDAHPQLFINVKTK